MNKINKIKEVAIVTGLMLWVACSAFFEDDIEKDVVTLLAPVSGTETEIGTQTFWWDKMEGANGHRLQIVMPSFSQAETLMVDTLVQGDKYEMTLYPGVYEWRVRGENSAYVSQWNRATLTIIATDDLTRQTVSLRKPLENYFINDPTIAFQWDTLPNVDTYEMRLFEGGWEQNLVVDSLGITNFKLTLELEEGELWWGVRAINEKSKSLFTSRRLVVDRTPPVKPKLLLPADNATPDDTTVTFTWNSSDPQWSKVTDSLFIYEKRETVGKKLFHKERYSNKEATVKLNSGKTYLWSVKSVDQAGNERELDKDEERIVKTTN